MYFEEVFRELSKDNVRYLVAGGLAVNLYGVLRATTDLDILVDFSHANVSKLVKGLERANYKPTLPVKGSELVNPLKRRFWHEEKGIMLFTFKHKNNAIKQVDIFLENPIDFEELYENKRDIFIEDVKIPLVSLDDLMRLKELAGRKQDLADVKGLKKVKEVICDDE